MSTTRNKAELLPGRSAEFDISGNAVRASRDYQVMRNFSQDEFVPTNITGLPRIGDRHPVYTNLPVAKISPREDPNGIRWVVTVEYYWESSSSSDQNGDEGQKIRLVSRSGDTVEVAKDIMADQATGDLVLNSMSQPFENTKQYQHYDTNTVIVRRENTPPSVAMALNGTINSDSVTISNTGITIGAYKARLRISWKEADDGGDLKYEYTYVIQKRVNYVEGTDIGWKEAYIDCGYEYMDGSSVVRATEVDAWSGEERPSSKPVLLDGDGGLLADGEPPVYIVVNPYVAASWSSLHFEV